MRAGLRHTVAAALALAWVACAVPAAGQIDRYLGVAVAGVRVELEGRQIVEPDVVSLVSVGVGRPFSMTDVRESLRHLFALGRFDDVEADVEPSQGGVIVVFRLTAARAVQRVEFRGSTGVSPGDLERVVTDRHGRAPRATRAAAVRETLLAHLADRGYFKASVTPSVEPDRSGGASLVFTIDAGPQARIGAVRVEGDPPGGEAAALSTLRLAPGRAWDGVDVQRRRADWLADLHARGHYEAGVDVSIERHDDEARVDVTVDVELGPRVTLAFEGDAVPQSKRDELVPIRREASVDEDLLEDSKRRIEAWLTSQGYWRAAVDYTRELTEGEQRIVFRVKTGLLYYALDVDVSGVTALARADLDPLVKTRRGAPFVRAQLDADAQAVARAYEPLGYASVRVQADAVRTDAAALPGIPPGAAVVRPRLVVTEGPRTVIGDVAIIGATALGEPALRPLLRIRPGDPYVPAAIRADRTQVSLAYLNRGYRSIVIDTRTVLTADQTRADVTFAIVEGEQARVDRVILVGNVRTNARTILREVQLAPGDPVSLEALAESQRRLSALGLFRRVRVEDREEPGVTTRDVVITVEEAPATSIGYGAGLEAGSRLRRIDDPDSPAEERIEFAPRGFFEIGRRNLFGRNRSVNLYARASLRRAQPGVATQGDLAGYGFNEYRVVGTWREPRILSLPADATFSAVVEQGSRSSFSFRRQLLSFDVARRPTTGLTAIGRYAYGRTQTFNEEFNAEDRPLIDRLFPTVTLSTFSGALIRDTRDDLLDPTRGTQVSVSGDLAARAVGSEVGFVKVLTQGFVYRRVPRARRVVAAVGLRLGLATGFARDVERRDSEGLPIVGADGQALVDRVKDLPASERFYAGGDTTVRGFALDRLGPVDQDGFPTGGNALLIANGEVRFPLWRSFGGVAFLDGGNVFPLVDDIDLGDLRGSVGIGIRYRSPVGPIRLDVGFKLDRRTSAAGTRERAYVLHISIGQAF